MKEEDGRRSKQTINPEEMLSEARDGLVKCRELFILSTLMLMSNSTRKEELVFWGNIWFNASSEEERITRELVAPAKLKTGAFRTVPAVEKGVRNNARDFVKKIEDLFKCPFPQEVGVAIVNPHIALTKKIQKEMGVPENTAHIGKTNVRRHTIFAQEPTLGKIAC